MQTIINRSVAITLVFSVAALLTPSLVAEPPEPVFTQSQGEGVASWEWYFPYELGFVGQGTHDDQGTIQVLYRQPCDSVDWCWEFNFIGNVAVATCYYSSTGTVEGIIMETVSGASKEAETCSASLGSSGHFPNGPCSPAASIETGDGFTGASTSSTGTCTSA